MKMGLSLHPSLKIDLPSFRPLCHIVNLLGGQGNIEAEDVKLAIADYKAKHPEGGLAYRVEGLFQPDLQTPSQAVAYWLRSVNPSAIKVAALCLEDQVSESDPDVLQAALTTILHTLELYRDSRSLLVQRRESVRGKRALEKANELYELMKKATITSDKSYLERTLTSDAYI